MHDSKKIRVSVIGAAGYGGGEVIRLLRQHPQVELKHLVSQSFHGQPLRKLFPGWGKDERVFDALDIEQIGRDSDIVFTAQEAGFAMAHAATFLEQGCRIVDFSADFRLRSALVFKEWYKLEHKAEGLLAQAVYGLPELFREEVRRAVLIANPGCYPTASSLALIPLLENGLVDPASIVIDAKSGVSGAGRGKANPDFLFSEVDESVKAYSVGGVHRHTPEIEQVLSTAAGENIRVSFTPHLIPMTRGILATCYATLAKTTNTSELVSMYRERYANESFVVILPEQEFPSSKSTWGSNLCVLGITSDTRTGRVTVVSAIDNLIKGAAGQALQNMNIMCGIDETAGLAMQGVWP